MEVENYFGNYTLSESSLACLQEIRKLLNPDSHPPDPAWSIIKPAIKKKDVLRDVVEQKFEQDADEDVKAQPDETLSTQFFYTQRERDTSMSIHVETEIVSNWSDVAESLLESLENTIDSLQWNHLKSLSDDEIDIVFKYLSGRLSLKGIFNLCRSVCSMDGDDGTRYIKFICTDVLLGQIIVLEEPSRLLITVLQELVQKFPEDVQEFIYVPMLNAEIHHTSVFSAIINSYGAQRKNDLFLNFMTTVRELKEWHINVLSELITSKISDNILKDNLLELLLEKASIYSREKNYGKFILSFMKLNNPFTENQKRILSEIIAVNETIFKRVMINLLNNMYLYGDLWHIA